MFPRRPFRSFIYSYPTQQDCVFTLVFASTSSTSMSLNNSLKTVPETSKFGISSPNGSSDSIPV